MPRKGEGVGDVGRASARQISAPVFGHIQVAVDQRMAQGRDVGEKNTDLAVLDLSGRPAILGSDARRVAAAFGKAADHSSTRIGKGGSSPAEPGGDKVW
jgi:hypothetical protein